MNSLIALIQMARRDGISYDRMSERATLAGYSITKEYLSKLGRGKVQLPSAHMLEALAAALAVPVDTVKDAAARSVGLHVDRGLDHRTTALLDRVAGLDEPTRDLWFRLAAAMAGELRHP